jgi:hypothetical protein
MTLPTKWGPIINLKNTFPSLPNTAITVEASRTQASVDFIGMLYSGLLAFEYLCRWPTQRPTSAIVKYSLLLLKYQPI